ncbi:MAG: helix-turn-helix domain-containing protein [Candidatus Zixiibacteriota bacterium]
MQKLLTPDEVAEYLGVKKSTIYQCTHQEYIQHIKIGRFRRETGEAGRIGGITEAESLWGQKSGVKKVEIDGILSLT